MCKKVPSPRSGLPVLLAIAFAPSACSPERADDACRADCELAVVLPENPDTPPRVPPVLRVAGNQPLTIEVRGRRAAQARSVLVFEEPAVTDEVGSPRFTVELLPGRNATRVRAFEDGVCHGPDGCGYFVVNTGLAARPPATRPAGLLIIVPE